MNQFMKNMKIINIIGSGSIGQVYKIKDKRTNEFYALKCIHPDIINEIIYLEWITWFINISKYIIFFISD